MRKFLFLIAAVLFISSCGVRYKQVPYFQDLRDSGVVSEQIDNFSPLKIQKGDVLAISVSSLNSDASAIFNLGDNNNISSSNTQATNSGFIVDVAGNIQLPLIGSLSVAGLTTVQARELIQKKLVSYLKEPIVNLRLVNLKISVLGDVSRPGVYPIQNEKISVSEALGMAGDLNITALRNNVLLVREKDGERQFIRLNLHQKNLFNSPYYYLQNNDVLYVQPSNAKYASVDSSYRNVSLILSAVSIIAIIISRL